MCEPAAPIEIDQICDRYWRDLTTSRLPSPYLCVLNLCYWRLLCEASAFHLFNILPWDMLISDLLIHTYFLLVVDTCSKGTCLVEHSASSIDLQRFAIMNWRSVHITIRRCNVILTVSDSFGWKKCIAIFCTRCLVTFNESHTYSKQALFPQQS